MTCLPPCAFISPGYCSELAPEDTTPGALQATIYQCHPGGEMEALQVFCNADVSEWCWVNSVRLRVHR